MSKCSIVDCIKEVVDIGSYCPEHGEMIDKILNPSRCKVDECEREALSYVGICHLHNRRLKRTGSFDDPRDRLIATKSPSLIDLHWAAGFLEGEGSFQFPHRVSASQVQEEPLLRLREMFGGKIGITKRPESKPNQKDCHSWNTSGSRARGIMMTLYPLMSTKRKEQIKQALFSLS